MKLDNLVIFENETLRDAYQSIEDNHLGVIFVVDIHGAVKGVATDGDIRRYLLNGGELGDRISKCVNHDFVWESPSTPRELLLKKLDHSIRIIPLLDSKRKLSGIVTRDYLPEQVEGAVYSRARAPVRISFGGGGSDITHYFSESNLGAVINTTISLYSHASLRIRSDEKIIVHSLDLDETLRANDLRSFLAVTGRWGLIQAIVRAINPKFGFELSLHSDFPMSSGLGGSAAVAAVILGCFNQMRHDQWDRYEMAELAYQAERHYLGIAGGWQDQYATIFGGFNFMEFRMDQNIVHPLRIHPDKVSELEECLVLCDTGTTHNSGDIHQDQRQNMKITNVLKMIEDNVQLSYQIRNTLLRGQLEKFGQLLDKAWELKRQLSNKISSQYLDQIYYDAKSNGAVGGKLLGAGGGGFFLFYSSYHRKNQLIAHLKSNGLKICPFRFESQGLTSWKERDTLSSNEIVGL